MGKKRKNSGFSNELDYHDDADDLGYDLRLVRRWKRRCISNKVIKSEASKETLEANSVNLDIDDDDDDNENFVDADYKKYLDSLSSTLTGEDSVPNQRTFDSGDDENLSMQTDALNNDADTDKLNNLESNNIEIGGNSGVVADSTKNEDSGCVDVDAGSSQTQSADNRTCQNDDLDNMDPDYDFFLKNMGMDWNDSCSNVFKDSGHIDVDTSQGDDLDDPDDDLSPKDGKEDENVAFCNFSDGGSLQTRSGNNDTSQNDDLDNNDPDYEFFLKNVRQDGSSFVLEIPEFDGISQIIKYELGDGCRVENPDTSKSSQEGSLEFNMLDESYDKFINALKNERGLTAYVPENGPKVVYDEDEEESSSDSDVIILETNPISQSYDIILSDDEERESDKAVSKSDCWFREKVVEILKKPFDQAEYDRLLHEVQVHKPVTEDRDMRYGRCRRRVVHTSGKSYLDVHEDLRRKIFSARSKPKVLNLLRGFFYWLQNTPHGVFKPWEDKLCLLVLPSEVASRPLLKKENIN